MIVTTTADIVAEDGETSLREAIAEANATPGADIVSFAPALSGATLRLTEGELTVSDTLLIDGDLDGDDAPDITISGDANGDDVLTDGLTDVAASLDGQDLLADNVRLIGVEPGTQATLSLIGLVLTGGRTTGGGSEGGAVVSDRAVIVRDSVLAGNSTGGQNADGGAISAMELWVADSVLRGNLTTGDQSGGGALFAAGAMRLDGVVLENNTTEGLNADGGALFANSGGEIAGSVFRGNATLGELSSGGAVSSASGVPLVIADSLFADNTTAGDNAPGGAVWGGAVTISGSNLTANATQGASSGGGAVLGNTRLDIVDSVLTDNATSGNTSGGGAVQATAPLVVQGSVLEGNRATGDNSFGGAVFASEGMLVEESRIAGNEAEGPGGGLFASAGSVVVARSEISGNLTTGNGGNGGGISATPLSAVTHVLDSLLTGNATLGLGARGGGLAAQEATVVGSTIAGNLTAGPNALGAAIASTGPLTLVASTVTGNAAAGTGVRVAGIIGLDGEIRIANSIVLGNGALTEGPGAELDVFRGSIAFAGENIVGADADAFDATAGNPDIVTGAGAVSNAAPATVFALTAEATADADGDGVADTPTGVTGGALADNLGLLPTVALAEGSNPAVDAGDGAAALLLDETRLGLDLNGDGDLSDLLTRADQIRFDTRGEGFAREAGADPDLGAVERGAGPGPAAPEQGVIRGTGRDDVIAVAQNAIYLGQAGEDRFLVSEAAVPAATSVIDDDPGTVIELAEGLVIVSSLVAGDAIQLVLADGARVQILESADHLFALGANATTGETGRVTDFDGFVGDVLGAEDTGGILEGGTVVIGPPAGAEPELF